MVFKKSLRYQPLTLTTLAALAPAELKVEFALFDEGIADVPLDLSADLIGITAITGSASRSYELARHFRSRGIKVVLGGPHVTLLPEEAMQHADADASAMPRRPSRSCCAVSPPAGCGSAMTRGGNSSSPTCRFRVASFWTDAAF